MPVLSREKTFIASQVDHCQRRHLNHEEETFRGINNLLTSRFQDSSQELREQLQMCVCFLQFVPGESFFMKKFRITALFAAIAFAGCGEPPKDVPKVALHPLTGIINVNGKPVGGAIVSLHASGTTELGVVTPHGITDDTGKFSLSTYQPEDGAPEGKYQVTVSWADKLAGSSSDPEYGPEKLPFRYQNPAMSGLELEVKPGLSEAIVMELKTR
jgi:hypothetical protein